MAQTGILSPDERLELIRGVIRRMSLKNRAQVVAASLAFDLFREALRGKASVYKEDPLRAEGIDSEPEPDVMVCSNPELAAYGTARTKPLLVIEVADSSLEYDLGEKAALYAQAGVPEYWVVNLVERVLEVFREPENGSYQMRASLEQSSRVTPKAWPDLKVEVASLFPKDAPEP